MSLLRLRWLKSIRFRKIPEVNVIQRNHSNQSKPSSANRLAGYVEPSSVRFFNVARKQLDRPRNLFTSRIDFSDSAEREFDAVQFDRISEETLESLTEYFDELVERAEHLRDADVSYGNGVLTVKFGDEYGTYVINRQTPNRQIWLSSPRSGPKRYDYISGKWIYKHDGKSLHELLDAEIPAIVKGDASFGRCSHGGDKATREHSR